MGVTVTVVMPYGVGVMVAVITLHGATAAVVIITSSLGHKRES